MKRLQNGYSDFEWGVDSWAGCQLPIEDLNIRFFVAFGQGVFTIYAPNPSLFRSLQSPVTRARVFYDMILP